MYASARYKVPYIIYVNYIKVDALASSCCYAIVRYIFSTYNRRVRHLSLARFSFVKQVRHECLGNMVLHGWNDYSSVVRAPEST